MEDRQEVAVQRPLLAMIQSECALTLENAGSRRNLTDALIRTERLTTRGAALDNECGRVQFDRTNETRKWGVSDPLGTGLGAKKGAAKWGSLTPHLPPCVVASPHRQEHGRHRAPPADVRRSSRLETTCVVASLLVAIVARAAAPRMRPAFDEGERCSRLSVPPPVPPERSNDTRPGDESG
jgi:hypothetical protein